MFLLPKPGRRELRRLFSRIPVLVFYCHQLKPPWTTPLTKPKAIIYHTRISHYTYLRDIRERRRSRPVHENLPEKRTVYVIFWFQHLSPGYFVRNSIILAINPFIAMAESHPGLSSKYVDEFTGYSLPFPLTPPTSTNRAPLLAYFSLLPPLLVITPSVDTPKPRTFSITSGRTRFPRYRVVYYLSFFHFHALLR